MSPVHIVGAGGIGCAVGYALQQARWPVVMVDVDEAKLVAGRQHGIQVEGPAKRRIVPLLLGMGRGGLGNWLKSATNPSGNWTFTRFADWEPPTDALILLCTKCYDNTAVLAKVPAQARLVPIQNGFDPQLEALHHEVEGIASFVSECRPDRPYTWITRPGDLHLGARGGAIPDWLPPLATALRRARLFRVVEVADVRPYKHAKLMYNAAISPLAAAAGLDNGDLLALPEARRLFFGLLQENYTILAAADKPLGKVGPFHPTTVMKILRRDWLSRPLARAFTPSLRGTYCSMAGDIVKGRTEIENYNGRLVAWADTTSCPRNRRVVEVIRRLESERAAPHRDVLRQFEI